MGGMRRYPIESRQAKTPPAYDRVVKSLTDGQLRDELEHERGSNDYREAVRVELERRGGQENE